MYRTARSPHCRRTDRRHAVTAGTGPSGGALLVTCHLAVSSTVMGGKVQLAGLISWRQTSCHCTAFSVSIHPSRGIQVSGSGDEGGRQLIVADDLKQPAGRIYPGTVGLESACCFQ